MFSKLENVKNQMIGKRLHSDLILKNKEKTIEQINP